jgi:hypothetical protein
VIDFVLVAGVSFFPLTFLIVVVSLRLLGATHGLLVIGTLLGTFLWMLVGVWWLNRSPRR